VSGNVPQLHPTEEAAALTPAAGAGLAALLTSHVLRDGELVLLTLKPSLLFIPLQSLRFAVIAGFFALLAASIALGFGYAFYLPHGALAAFVPCLFFVGVGGASFAVYIVWIPEQYRTECRGSAFAFATSSGRFITAGVTFLVGAAVSSMHTIGTPVALTSLAFLVGLALLPAAEETRGKELPA